MKPRNEEEEPVSQKELTSEQERVTYEWQDTAAVYKAR
jgi:hypothetical protein